MPLAPFGAQTCRVRLVLGVRKDWKSAVAATAPCAPRVWGAGWERGHPAVRERGPEPRSPLRRRGGGAEARERAELALLTAVREHGG